MSAKRSERIGADSARVWARELRLGNPYAKSVLLAVANYMNENGAAWPGLATIARDTDISEETISRRLRWLQEIGAVAVFKCWCDDSGQRNYNGRGRPTASEIRFLFAADPAAIETNAQADIEARPLRGAAKESAGISSPRPGRSLDDEISPRPASPLDQSQHPASPQLAPSQPPPGRGDSIDEEELEPELEEDSPPFPPQGGDMRFSNEGERQSNESLAPFIAAYPDQLIADYARTQAVWAAMTAQEQTDAIVGAKGYADLIRKERLSGRNRSVKDAHSWLRNRQWTGYLGAGKTIEAAKQRFHAAESSEEWRAWTVFYRCCGRRGIPESAMLTSGGTVRASVPSQWPPVGRGLDPDERKWSSFAEGTPQFAAWLRRLREIDVAIGLATVTIDGKQVRAIRAPCEWPPGKQAEAVAQAP